MNEINVLEFLEYAAEAYPERIALRDREEEISYADLHRFCQKAGAALSRESGGLRRSPVVVYIDRNIKSIMAFLAVVYSGNFYVPMDASFPRERIDGVLDTLKPVCQIDAREKGKTEEGIVPFGVLLERIHGEKVSIWPDRKSYVVSEEISEEEKTLIRRIREDGIDIDPLYCIFTSGTTGVPKGVVISHRSVIDLVHRFGEVFDFPDCPVFGNQAPFDFDVSVKDIYNSLYQGGTVVVIPKVYFVMPQSLLPYLQDNGVNVLIWAVSALRIVHNFKLFDACVPQGLRWIMFSGEVMPVRTLNYLRENLPDVNYVNLYGPTEITCNCNYYIVDRAYGEEEALPLGKSFPNTRVFLQDTESLRPVEEAEKIGEICVEGSCLALGYYGNREQTAQVFAQNPRTDAYQNLIYHTGDLGRYDKDGALYYVSRKDHQIKHMGHRIGLGEIETVVNAMEQIHMACCVFNQKKEQIVLFYCAEEECAREIRKAIQKKLPGFMMPGKINFLQALPMNSHDKIDRNRLSIMAEEA